MSAVGTRPDHRGGGELRERTKALGALRAALGERLAGRGNLVLVSGEAGVGKSALLDRFGCDVGGSARILRGACDPLFTPRPLGPFADIAGQVTGEFSDMVSAGAKPHQALHPFLAEISGADPAIVFIEDLHWADEASLDLIGLIGRRIGQVPALVVATYRSDELAPAHPLQRLLGTLATAPAVTRMPVEPLSPAAVAEIAAPYGIDAQQLYERTGGNPFFVTEVLSCGMGQLPPTVRDAVLARVAGAGQESRALIDVVAIMPAGVELSLLEAVADGGLAHLDECLALGILVEERGRIRFRHELARLVIEEAIRPARRVFLHRAALRAIRDSPTQVIDHARFAHHADQANDTAAVLELAPAAGDYAASVGAHREAAAQYARALRYAGSASPAERAHLYERLAYENYLSDQPDQAMDARRQALAIYRNLGDLRGEGESLCWLARLLFFASHDAEAEKAGREAIDVLERLPPGRELAMAYSTFAYMRMLAGDMAETVRWGERAVALAERCGETEVLVHALNNVGAAEFSQGLDRGRGKLERSLVLAREAALTEHVVRAYVNLASVAVDLRSYTLAEGYLCEGLAFATDAGIDAWRWYLLAVMSRALLETGRWKEAAEAAQAVLAVARPSSFARLTALVVTARLRARRGEGSYWPLLDEARRIASLNGHLQQAGPVIAARAEAHWLEGRRGEVGCETQECLEHAARLADGWTYGELACWRGRAGIDGDETGPAAEPFSLQLGGDHAAAAGYWLAAGCPYEAALALADSGGEPALRRALGILTDLEARASAAVVAARLRALGARGVPRGPTAATARNPAGLTARELDVLALIAESMPNADIAARLVLSPRTVEHHVTAILRKLSVDSRKQAREEALKSGIVGQP